MRDDGVDERRLSGPRAADDEDILAIGDRPFDDGLLTLGHDAGRNIIGEREDRCRLAPDREHRRQDDRWDEPLEATAIERQLAFEDRILPRDGRLMRGCNSGERRLGSYRGKRAEAAGRTPSALHPKRAIRIQEDLDDACVRKTGADLVPSSRESLS